MRLPARGHWSVPSRPRAQPLKHQTKSFQLKGVAKPLIFQIPSTKPNSLGARWLVVALSCRLCPATGTFRSASLAGRPVITPAPSKRKSIAAAELAHVFGIEFDESLAPGRA